MNSKQERTSNEDLSLREVNHHLKIIIQKLDDIIEKIDTTKSKPRRIEEEKLKPEEYQWYIDLRKYGSVTHSGFGMGIERAITWIAKLEHIRDSIAFPRLINRVYP